MIKALSILFVILVFVVTSVVSFVYGTERGRGEEREKSLQNLKQLCPKLISCNSFDKVDILSKMVDPYGQNKDFIVSTSIGQVLRGNLVSFTENSWTIKQKDNLITIKNESREILTNYILYDSKTQEKKSATVDNLKIGSSLTIFTFIVPYEWKTGVSNIYITK